MVGQAKLPARAVPKQPELHPSKVPELNLLGLPAAWLRMDR